MPYVLISDRAHEMILMKADWELRGTPQQQSDGNWSVPISDELHADLEAARFPGESLNACIVRVLPTWTGSASCPHGQANDAIRRHYGEGEADLLAAQIKDDHIQVAGGRPGKRRNLRLSGCHVKYRFHKL